MTELYPTDVSVGTSFSPKPNVDLPPHQAASAADASPVAPATVRVGTSRLPESDPIDLSGATGSASQAASSFTHAPQTASIDAMSLSPSYHASHIQPRAAHWGAEAPLQASAFVADYLRAGDYSRLALPETKSFATTPDRDGGYLVPEYLEIRLEEKIQELSPIRRLAQEIVVSHGSRVQIVRNRSGFEASWVTEKEARSATTTPDFVEQSINLHELYACPMASQRFLDDTAIDVEGWIVASVATAFAAAEARAFIHGDGVDQPLGVLRAPQRASGAQAGEGVFVEASGDANGLSDKPFDRLIDFMSGLDARYRTHAVWLMNASTLSVLRRIKDGDGNYIWQPSAQLGQASQLLGFPVIEDAMMPSITAGGLPIAFGDIGAAYTVIRRQGLSVLRDPYSMKPNVAFYATRRVGGAVTNMDAVRLLKIAVS